MLSPFKFAESATRTVSARMTGTCTGGSDRFSGEQAANTASKKPRQSFIADPSFVEQVEAYAGMYPYAAERRRILLRA